MTVYLTPPNDELHFEWIERGWTTEADWATALAGYLSRSAILGCICRHFSFEADCQTISLCKLVLNRPGNIETQTQRLLPQQNEVQYDPQLRIKVLLHQI